MSKVKLKVIKIIIVILIVIISIFIVGQYKMYLIDTIKIIANDKMAIKDFLKYVYGPVAERYDTRPQNELWCINKLISLMYFNTDEEVIEKYFNVNKNDKPSTKAFIIGIARKVC